DTDGVSLLREWAEGGGLQCPVVMMSGHANIETAVEATRLGAYDFIEKPLSMAKLLLILGRALEAARLKRENEGLRGQLAETSEPLGTSALMTSVRGQLERVSTVDAPLLLLGETGTGKQTLARWLHMRGPRSAAPFVVWSLAATPVEKQHAVLFGARSDAGVQPGMLDQAEGGSLFLNDIAELHPDAQRDLATAIDHGTFVRSGGSEPMPLTARIIAASTRELGNEVRAGRLREDLYFQLHGLPIDVPSLRARADDVPALLAHFADYFSNRDGLPYRRFATGAQNRLRQHAWPGNLRELRNLVQRLLVLGGGGDIELAEVERALGQAAQTRAIPSAGDSAAAFAIDYALPLREARDAFEHAYLTQLLKQADNSVGKLATLTGMERTHLYRKLRDLGIDPKGERG
ncbi:MAG: sigma-54 dependent transcriptional regulator, partial [Lysobacterales bacterium]